MNTLTHKVTFTDNTEVEVTWGFPPIAMIHAERELGKPVGPMLAEGYLEPIFYGIWFQLKKDGKTPFKYEQWLEFVENAEDITEKSGSDEPKAKPDPKPKAASKSS